MSLLHRMLKESVLFLEYTFFKRKDYIKGTDSTVKHRYPLSEVKYLILLQIRNVNTKIKFSQSPQFCFVSGENSDEHLPETTTSLGKYSVNPDKSIARVSPFALRLLLNCNSNL